MSISNGAKSLLQSVPDSFCTHCSRNSPRLLCSLVSYADLSSQQQFSIMYRFWLERPSSSQWAEQGGPAPGQHLIRCVCLYLTSSAASRRGNASKMQIYRQGSLQKNRKIWKPRGCDMLDFVFSIFFFMLIGCILHLCVSVCVCVTSRTQNWLCRLGL